MEEDCPSKKLLGKNRSFEMITWPLSKKKEEEKKKKKMLDESKTAEKTERGDECSFSGLSSFAGERARYVYSGINECARSWVGDEKSGR